MEIISYSPIHSVADDPQIWFREVGRGGAMVDQYDQVMGYLGSDVQAGILHQEGNRWYVEPAPLPIEKSNQLCEKSYCKVHENIIQEFSDDLPGFKTLYERGYKLQKKPYKVRFDVEKRILNIHNHEIEENIVTHIVKYEGNEGEYSFTGYLVSTGNMGHYPVPQNQRRRKYYPVVIAPEPQAPNPRIAINEEAVRLYKLNISDQINTDLGASGCLHEGNVVFYIPPSRENGEITYFGHNPYFRIPLLKNGDYVTPRDFILEVDKPEGKVDYAEAIFGPDLNPNDEGQGMAYSGRVSIMDAQINLAASGEQIWYHQPPNPIAPKILASPKATAYAHYLVQDRAKGHDPDGDKLDLANYGTSISETEIRGHKLYWTKGADPDFIEPEPEVREKGYTRIIALNKGVVFKTKIKFRNLRPHELGALLWALTLPGGGDRCRHRIGMGKPYGMGVIHIGAEVFISDREKQYTRLFSRSSESMSWYISNSKKDKKDFIREFEQNVIEQLRSPGNRPVPLSELPLSGFKRMETLLAMLTWEPDVSNAWRSETDYMGLKEFGELAVLPTPSGVIKKARHQQS